MTLSLDGSLVPLSPSEMRTLIAALREKIRYSTDAEAVPFKNVLAKVEHHYFNYTGENPLDLKD